MTVYTNDLRIFLWNTLRDVFGNTYNEYSPEWSQMFDEMAGEGPFIRNGGFSGLPYARLKTESSGISYADMESTFVAEFTPYVYALGFKLSREAFEDNKYEELGLKKTNALSFSMRQTKEVNHALFFDRAFNSAYPSADGKAVCATDHILYGGGSFSNTLTAALTEASLEQACINISKLKDDKGMKIKVLPTKLQTAPDNVFNKERILMGNERTGTADRDINALKRLGTIPSTMINHFVEDTDAWFIKTDCPDGLTSYTLRAVEFEENNEFDTQNFKAAASERYALGITDVRGIYGSPGAA